MFLQIDGTFFVQLINFGIFFLILNVVFIRPVGRAIAKRREHINSVTSDYEKYQSEGNALRAQAESIRAAARRDAEAAIGKVRAETSNQTAAIAAEYNAKAAEIVLQAHQTVGAEVEAAREKQPQLAEDLANLVVDRTLAETA